MKLRELAHSRTGDKGNISNISVIVYNEEDFDFVKERVTEERVKEWFSAVVKGDVIRYELTNLKALNFVLHEALSGGVTKSLALDAHGKTLSEFLLELDI